MIHARSTRVAAPVHVLLGSFAIDDPDGLHRTIRDARGGDFGALAAVLDDARRAAPHAWPDVNDGLVVPVPGHRAGGATSFVRRIAETVAASRDWQLTLDSLVRLHDVPEAKSGGPRVGIGEEASLAWRGDEDGDVIVLVDDVLRSGATLRACLAAIRKAGDGRPAVAVTVAAARQKIPRG